MNDYLVRIIARDAGVRGMACITTQIAQEAATRHATAPTATYALAQVMTGGALIGALLKVRQRVAIKFEGRGPLRKLLVESDSFGHVRGYVSNPDVDLPLVHGRHDLVMALGRAGLLTVVKDLNLKELPESVVPLATSTVDGDLTAYLEQSEQIPSIVQTGAILDDYGEVAVAGGLLVQSMPPHDATAVTQLKDRIQELPPIEDLLRSGSTPETVLSLVFDGIEYTLLEQRPLQFKCTCSRERSQKALITLGVVEIEQILQNEGQAVIDCHFCHERYIFTGPELEDLIAALS